MFQVGGACYTTANQAAQATASAQVGAVVSTGGTAYALNVAATSDSSITYVLQPLAGGTSLQSVVSYTAQPCGLLQAEDGAAIGWMIAGAWIGAYALMFLARALRGEPVNDYGNT